MKYLTNEKLTIVGAGGMIGSNMAQTALMLGLTPNICLYDIFEPGVHGVAGKCITAVSRVQTLPGPLILKLLSRMPSISFLQVELHVKRA